MKTYWDTSAVINAAISAEVMDRLDTGEHVTRLHTFAEFFSTMTGRGVEVADQAGTAVRVLFAPNDCAQWLRAFSDKVGLEELSRDELLDAIDEAQARNVQGAKVYDYWHALVCRKAKADELLTRNTWHFEELGRTISAPTKVTWP